MDIHIWGPASNYQSLHTRLSRYLSPPLFPVHIRDLPCKHTMHEIDNSEFEIGPFKIQSKYIIHPGPTVGFRISGKKSVFTYMPVDLAGRRRCVVLVEGRVPIVRATLRHVSGRLRLQNGQCAHRHGSDHSCALTVTLATGAF
jgi:hypothetical protein